MFALAILVCAGVAGASWYYARNLTAPEGPGRRWWFRAWAVRGLGLPLLFWVIWNLGLLPGLPPLMPQVAGLKASGGPWLLELLDVSAPALLVISSCWGAVGLVWMLGPLAGRDDIRTDFLGGALAWSVLLLPLATLLVWFGGWLVAGFATLLWLVPIAHSSLPLMRIKKLGPQYSRATARLKMGRFEDAEWEVIHELEKHEEDFEGWMMLAELYANQFNDLPAAERTIQDICNQPAATPSQISIALHRLADWQLRPGDDPVAARRSLEEICHRLPGTHLATMARHRLNQLPESRAALLRQREGIKMHLPLLAEKASEPDPADQTEAGRERWLGRANACVDQLKLNPDDVPAREELAKVFAERLDQPQLALDQLGLLLAMPGQPVEKAAEWLSLMADWELRRCHNPEEARKLMERLVREYPQSMQAFTAQRDLKFMEVARRMHKLRAGPAPPPAIPEKRTMVLKS